MEEEWELARKGSFLVGVPNGIEKLRCGPQLPFRGVRFFGFSMDLSLHGAVEKPSRFFCLNLLNAYVEMFETRSSMLEDLTAIFPGPLFKKSWPDGLIFLTGYSTPL